MCRTCAVPRVNEKGGSEGERLSTAEPWLTVQVLGFSPHLMISQDVCTTSCHKKNQSDNRKALCLLTPPDVFFALFPLDCRHGYVVCVCLCVCAWVRVHPSGFKACIWWITPPMNTCTCVILNPPVSVCVFVHAKQQLFMYDTQTWTGCVCSWCETTRPHLRQMHPRNTETQREALWTVAESVAERWWFEVGLGWGTKVCLTQWVPNEWRLLRQFAVTWWDVIDRMSTVWYWTMSNYSEWLIVVFDFQLNGCYLNLYRPIDSEPVGIQEQDNRYLFIDDIMQCMYV